MMSRVERRSFPILGVLGLNYLRETGLVQMMREVRVAYFGPVDSGLHRIADYSIPVRDLDGGETEVLGVIRSARRRQINLDGLITLRDGNVQMTANIARRFRLPGPDPRSLLPLQCKSSLREFLEHNVPRNLQTLVLSRRVPRGISRRQFSQVLDDLLNAGPVILKPDRGSCSYFIIGIANREEIPGAWRKFRACEDFRGGDFVAERRLQGREFAVETVLDESIRDMRITQYLPPEAGLFHETGHFVPDEFVPTERNAIFRLVSEIHSRLRLKHMITHMELMLPENGLPGVIDLNPRLAGDLTQELHGLTSGIEFYRIAARIATGQPVSDSYFTERGQHRCALIRFKSPGRGTFSIRRWPLRELVGRDDRFGLIGLASDAIGNTNSDRPGYVLLAGDNRSELEKRAGKLLRRITPN